jgi:hypothetical protein
MYVAVLCVIGLVAVLATAWLANFQLITLKVPLHLTADIESEEFRSWLEQFEGWLLWG